MRRIVISIIKFYTFLISPLLGTGKCRFYPNCSSYTIQVIENHGLLKGVVLGLKRILKCHPWHTKGFYDPPPEEIDWQEIIGYKSTHSHQSHTTHK